MFNVFKTDRFLGFNSNYEDSDVVLVGVPFDGTTSYRPGARFAPNAIRVDSYGLETYSPYLDKDIEDLKLSDIGDIELPFGNVELAINNIKYVVDNIINDDKSPFIIGGEHLVSLPIIKSLSKKYPDLHVLHLDAHCDLREDYMGETLSHATVFKRVWDFLGDDRIFQFGIRSGTKEEFEYSESHTYMERYSISTLSGIASELKDKPIYLTIDLDVLDPSFFPGTGTPEPGGITMKELLNGIVSLKYNNIVGADVVELSPSYDTSGVSTTVASKVIRELSIILSNSK